MRDQLIARSPAGLQHEMVDLREAAAESG